MYEKILPGGQRATLATRKCRLRLDESHYALTMGVNILAGEFRMFV